MSVAAGGAVPENGVRSLIPARIDRLPWSPFHTRMVAALGVAWILDGLEISVASAVGDTLTKPETLALSSTQVGLIATVYLVGEVVGALVFGALSDRLGRRNLFTITLAVYFVGSGLTALTLGNGTGWLVFLYATRFISGMGIGGEYAAINSAIDELIPAKLPRPHRHHGQRHLLVRRADRQHRHAIVLLNQLRPERWPGGSASRSARCSASSSSSSGGTCPRARAGRSCTAGPRQAEESIAFMEREVQEKTGRAAAARRRGQGHRDQAGRADHGYLHPAAGALPRVPDAGRSSAPR